MPSDVARPGDGMFRVLARLEFLIRERNEVIDACAASYDRLRAEGL